MFCLTFLIVTVADQLLNAEPHCRCPCLTDSCELLVAHMAHTVICPCNDVGIEAPAQESTGMEFARTVSDKHGGHRGWHQSLPESH